MRGSSLRPNPSAAFAARDAVAALACFVTDDDIGYVGSENAETAAGRAAVETLLTTLFARDEAYSWQVTKALVREYGDCAYLFAQADGLVHTDAGDTVPFAYRISGVLETSAAFGSGATATAASPQAKTDPCAGRGGEPGRLRLDTGVGRQQAAAATAPAVAPP
jgi:ketosteroid isomerase-like protein